MRFYFLTCFIFVGAIAYAQSYADSAALVRGNAAALKRYLSNPDSAITIASATLARAKILKLQSAAGQSYYILSKANWVKANFRLSVEYAYRSLQIFENSPNTLLWVESLLALARNFMDIGNDAQAQAMINASLLLSEQHPTDHALRALVYREYSAILLHRNQYDSAILYADKSLAFFEELGDFQNTGILYGRKARAYFLKKDYQTSIYFNLKSLKNEKLSSNKRGLSIDLYQSAENYLRLNMLDSAIAKLKESEALAVFIGNLLWQIKCHEMMAAIFEKKNKTQEAIFEFKTILKLKDTLQQKETARLVAEAKALNELENMDKTMRLLEEENKAEKQLVRDQKIISWSLFTGILLLAVVIGLLWYFRRNQQKVNHQLALKNDDIGQQREEIRQQAAELDQLNKLKSKLFSVISHDLRGPVSNIQNLLGMLTKQIITPAEFVEVSEKLKVELNINQQTLENLLAWSLSQMDGIRTDPQSLKIADVILSVTFLLEQMAKRKGIAFKTELESDLVAHADSDQIQLVLRNIIHNAIKFSLNDGVILVTARKTNDQCRVSVLDYGIGLNANEIEILSGKHEYYTKAGTQQEKGTGLGWLLSREFIYRNGGSFAIQSAPGSGTEISFSLPLA